jgi:hypothetical protein
MPKSAKDEYSVKFVLAKNKLIDDTAAVLFQRVDESAMPPLPLLSYPDKERTVVFLLVFA